MSGSCQLIESAKQTCVSFFPSLLRTSDVAWHRKIWMFGLKSEDVLSEASNEGLLRHRVARAAEAACAKLSSSCPLRVNRKPPD